jgi:serine/threonine protein kinase
MEEKVHYHCKTVCNGKLFWFRDDQQPHFIPRKCTQSKIEFCHDSNTSKIVHIRKTFQDRTIYDLEKRMLKLCFKLDGVPQIIRENPSTLSIDTTYCGEPVVSSTIPSNCIEQIQQLEMSLTSVGIEHNDLVPHNVLVNAETSKLSLIDFGRSKDIPKDKRGDGQRKAQKLQFVQLAEILCSPSKNQLYHKQRIKPKLNLSRLRKSQLGSVKTFSIFVLLLFYCCFTSAHAGWLFTTQPVVDSNDNDPYSLLKVSRKSTLKDIKRSYRKLSLKHHPDRNPKNPSATQMFARLAVAHDIISDPVRREIYDRLGHYGLERYDDDDPTVMKDYVPPDDEDLNWLDRFVQNIFTAAFGNTDW